MDGHSKLVQRTIKYATDADKAFSKLTHNEIPMVLVPRKPVLFHLALNVPSGPFVIWQRFMKDKGSLEPGVKWFWPAWNYISHIVTRSVISYNAPARNCPTADSVMVSVDLSLTFQIGPDIEAARKFVYRLGPNRFDELLSAETEEAIRGLVYSVTHDKVNDLREEFASNMLATLNSKVEPFGVQILNVKVTNVKLPRELQQRLEHTTAFKTKMEEQEKSHENQIHALKDNAELELETIRKANTRKIQEIIAERNVFETQKREMEEEARGEGRVREVEAKTKAGVSLTHAKGTYLVNKVKGQQHVEEILKTADIGAQRITVEADKKAYVSIRESETGLQVAEYQAGAMVVSAEAEAEAAEALAEKRRYDLEWSRLEVQKKIAKNGRKFISGEQGQAILDALIPKAGIKT